jgi:hypothetical protein
MVTEAGVRPGPRPQRQHRAVKRLGMVAGTLVSVAVVGGVLLSLYPARAYRIPVGDDVPTYIWRARVVASGGLDALSRANQYRFHSNTSNPGRPGYPVMAALIDDVSNVSTWRIAFALPAVAAVAIGLAAGALAVECIGEPLWSFPLYALTVGLSACVVITAKGYYDNLLADATILAAIATALMLLEGRRAGTATAWLLAGTAVIHWQFALLLAMYLFVLALTSVPESIRASREGRRLAETPSARLLGALGAGAVAGGAGLLLTPGLSSFGTNDRQRFETILQVQLPLYVFPATGPVMVGGAAALAAGRDPRRLRALVAFVLSILIGLVAYVAFRAGANLPAQRLLGAALGMPMLFAAAVVGLIRLILRVATGAVVRKLAVVGAGVILLASVAGTIAIGARAWYRTIPYEELPRHAAIASVMQYVRQLPPDVPVVFVVQGTRADFGAIPALRRLRAQAPPERIPDVYVYLGTPENLLRGVPTTRPSDPEFGTDSAQYFAVVRPIMHRHPVIVVPFTFYLHDYHRVHKAHPEWPSGDRFLVVRGPAPAANVPIPRDPVVQGIAPLTVAAVLMLLVLAGAGLGWSSSLVPASWGVRAALSPAFGFSALAAGGLVADRLGVALRGAAGGAVALAIALVGWIPLAIRGRRPTSSHVGKPNLSGSS